jgi:hypothetical protein
MTGEITLRGRVLPIGGLKQKILAAHLSGAKTVIIPKKNEKDLRDIPEEIRKQIKIIPVETSEHVLDAALRRRPTPLLAKGSKQSTDEPKDESRGEPVPGRDADGGKVRRPGFPRPEQPPVMVLPASRTDARGRPASGPRGV